VGPERGSLSLVSTIEGLLGRKNSGSSIESLEYARRDLSRSPRGTPYPQKLAQTSDGVVHSRIQATEFFDSLCIRTVSSVIWLFLY
jgi:hypothetical protein